MNKAGAIDLGDNHSPPIQDPNSSCPVNQVEISLATHEDREAILAELQGSSESLKEFLEALSERVQTMIQDFATKIFQDINSRTSDLVKNLQDLDRTCMENNHLETELEQSRRIIDTLHRCIQGRTSE
eukprot:TRINITY_DN4097_c0_g1_i14.p1 TRINITY_DN4097_c0_g1~~TRINITY_DN4097_c0_g1_i14.p1  ORF type:complete len:128 (+),score=27.09 TRINITY_DN4097_c0_g1_i14:122-505(+)